MPRSSTPPLLTIDTNLFVSGTIIRRGGPYALLEAWRSGAIRLVTSRQQLEELARALRRPRVQKYGVTTTALESLLDELANSADIVVPKLPAAIPVRDPHDEHILALALDGQADYLVTGDEDLLVLAGDERVGSLAIVTVADFLRILDDKTEADPPAR